MKILMILSALILATPELFSQVADSTDLFRELQQKDSLLFDIGFNRCDISQFENLVSDSFEFYHDQGGITSSKSEFISGIEEGLCKLPYKPSRVLDEGSLTVYPLEENGVLYGAIQMGTHRFYAGEKDADERGELTSTARFTHVWILEEGEWKLRRAFSYDHKTPEEKEANESEPEEGLRD